MGIICWLSTRECSLAPNGVSRNVRPWEHGGMCKGVSPAPRRGRRSGAWQWGRNPVVPETEPARRRTKSWGGWVVGDGNIVRDRMRQQAMQNHGGEFDPGSGSTLAACLMHASRTGPLSGGLRGGRVRNTWAIWPEVGGSPRKRGVIPHGSASWWGMWAKGLRSRLGGSLRPIS
jgi:hypothetical protein